jgi:hypothetical protein
MERAMPWQPLGGETTEITAIHAALLPTSPQGDILCFGDWAGSGSGGVVQTTLSRLFRVQDGTIEAFADEDLPDTNGFCGGHAWLADGRMLLGGGTQGWPAVSEAHDHDPHYDGERACWLYLPQQRRWTRVKDMRFQPGSNSIGGGRWYPTLVTLGNGEVMAIAGHPDVTDTYNGRHNNNTPERYSPAANSWTLLEDGHTAPDNRNTDSYPRFHLLPDGRLFCDTSGDEGDQQILDPWTGLWVGDAVNASALPDYYSEGSAATSVLLPLLPPSYTPRVAAFNSPSASAFRIDPAANDPAWTTTPDRIGPMAGRNRENGCATLLPTGHVALTGGWPRGSGDDPMDDDLANATLGAEIYDPGIDWGAGDFSGNEGWLDEGGAAAVVGRGYHSTALLLPDGRVWTAGSTGALVGGEDRVEYYAPFYVGQSRPTLSGVPAATTYGATFTATVDRAIERVALIRSGTITHGFNSDQRYIGLEFEQDGDELTITAPPNGNIAPPGPYMLWVIDADDRPCELAAFIRLSSQQLLLYTDRSTFSVHEVDVLGTPAQFNYAFYLVLDGALPGEVGDPVASPEIAFTYPGGETVPDMGWQLATSKWEDPSAPPDTAQRLTFACHIRFESDDAFDAITGESDDIQIRATFGGFTVSAPLKLTKNPNPWMRDGETPWLSTDVRVFQIQPGFSIAGVVHGSGPDAPYTFIKALCEKFESLEPEVETHPFLNELETDQAKSALTFAGEGGNGDPVYNYAVAKVRMTAPSEVDAEDVGVFFRLFRTASTGFEYRPESYSRDGSGAGAYPVIGRIDGDIVTIPFFSEPRAGEGAVQVDELNRKTIAGSGAESRRYFGCWLDINQTTPEFEEDGEMKSVQEILVGEHQCLVAEIDYALDTIPPGATPGSSENLSQRNLIINEAPNPASAATRVIAHSLEVAPSKTPAKLPPMMGSNPSLTARLAVDELVFSWGNIPAGSQVTVYLPDVDVDEVMALVARRSGAAMVARVDAHTIRLTVGGITYLPIPGGRQATIPALLTLQLPPDLVKGTVYKATIKQFDGQRRRIIASVQLTIPITTSEQILPEEGRKLAVYRHILSKMAAANKWRPVVERLVGVVADRVRGLGGDPDSIEPSPTGNPPKEGDMDIGDGFSGKVAAILYDCFGDFSGFVLESCREKRRFEACEPGIEKVVRAACHDRDTITVMGGKGGRDIKGIVVHCCAGGAKALREEREKPAVMERVRQKQREPASQAPAAPKPQPVAGGGQDHGAHDHGAHHHGDQGAHEHQEPASSLRRDDRPGMAG